MGTALGGGGEADTIKAYQRCAQSKVQGTWCKVPLTHKGALRGDSVTALPNHAYLRHEKKTKESRECEGSIESLASFPVVNGA